MEPFVTSHYGLVSPCSTQCEVCDSGLQPPSEEDEGNKHSWVEINWTKSSLAGTTQVFDRPVVLVQLATLLWERLEPALDRLARPLTSTKTCLGMGRRYKDLPVPPVCAL